MKTAVDSVAPSARPPRWRLIHHLLVVLAVKFILLALLWCAFIRPNKVAVDADVMGGHIVGAAPRLSLPIPSGDKQ
jgi:hypothetical protein